MKENQYSVPVFIPDVLVKSLKKMVFKTEFSYVVT